MSFHIISAVANELRNSKSDLDHDLANGFLRVVPQRHFLEHPA
jgi:hypothetical protein